MIRLTEDEFDRALEVAWRAGRSGMRHSTAGLEMPCPDWETACREVGADHDAASNEIAEHISAITGDEVDGDGDPWSIVCQHLDGVAEAIADVRHRFPEADAHLRSEYAWGDTRDPYRSEAEHSEGDA